MIKKLLLFAAFVPTLAFAQQKTYSLQVANHYMKAKTDEPVVMKLDKVDFRVKQAIVRLKGKEIPCQLDDMNGDCRPDELVFLADIPAKSKQKYTVVLKAKGEQKQFPSRVYAHMGLNDKYEKYPEIRGIEAPGASELFKDVYPHGAEFESDYTAFRVYMDNRQNIDLYGKRQARLELARTHFYSQKQDLDSLYGNDVLWAGKSMGCGTLREFQQNHENRTLGIKYGSPLLIDQVGWRSQRIVAFGPLRTVVEMKDIDWKGNNITTHYIMYAGHREVEVQVMADAPVKNMQFCTGVQKVGEAGVGKFLNNTIAASWGEDYPDHGKKELYAPAKVGLAVYVPEKHFAGNAEDSLQYMCLINLNKKNFAHYYVTFCCAFENFSSLKSENDWFYSLNEWRENLRNKVRVHCLQRRKNRNSDK